MPPNIIDYRDPKRARGRRFKYDKPIIGKHMQDVKTHGYFKVPSTHVTLTKDGKVIVWYWGHANTIEWGALLNLLKQQVDPIQGDMDDLVAYRTGYIIHRSRETGQWIGDRNRYSTDIIRLVQALLDRGIAASSTTIWIGNTATKRGEHLGTVQQILARGALPSRVIVYHGTDTLRLSIIEKVGLRPMAFDDRVWNRSSLDKERPEHREDSVYLTASRPQAEYYAMKATNIDRKRYGPSKRAEIRHAIDNAEAMIQRFTYELERFARMTPEQIAAEDAHRQKYGHREFTIGDKQSYYPSAIERSRAVVERGRRLEAHKFYGPVQPVILQVTLSAKDFDKLMADDDYLHRAPEANPEDWRESLSHFGQIAFRGIIPPERIKVIAIGGEAGRVSH